MLINDTNLTLCKTTFTDIAAAAPLKDVERWDDGWGLDCKTDGPIEVEGMRFRASFSCKRQALFYIVYGKKIFTLYGKQYFTLPGREFFTSLPGSRLSRQVLCQPKTSGCLSR